MATATHVPILAVLTARTLVAVMESWTLASNATKVQTTVIQLQMLAEKAVSFHLVVTELLTEMKTVTMEMPVDTLDAFAASSHVVTELDNQTRTVMMAKLTATLQGTDAVSTASSLLVEMV